MIKTVLAAIQKKLSVFALLVTFVLIQFLLHDKYIQWDATEDGVYTLSEATVNVLNELEDPLTIKVYLSNTIPQNLLSVKQNIVDIVGIIADANKDHIILEILDPVNDQIAQEETKNFEIPEIEFSVSESESLQVTKGNIGIALLYQDRQEIIPLVLRTEVLEFELAKRIQQLVHPEKQTIIVLSDTNMLDDLLINGLKEYFDVIEDISEPLSDKIAAAIVIGTPEQLTEEKLALLDTFYRNGGNVLVLTNGLLVDQKTFTTTKKEHPLFNWLKDNAIEIEQKVIADFASHEIISFTGAAQTVSKEYPFWPRLTHQTMNTEFPPTAVLNSLTLPWPSPLKINSAQEQIDVLFRTSSESYAFDDQVSVGVDSIQQPIQLEQYVVAAMIPPAGEQSTTATEAAKAHGTMVVVGSSHFIEDPVISKIVDNSIFLFNTVDILSNNAQFIDIRARSSIDRPLRALSVSQKTVIRYGSIFGSVIAVLIIGVLLYGWRKRNDARAKKIYA